MKRMLCLCVLLLFLSGCHVADIPYIGWRLDVAMQRKHYQKTQRELEKERVDQEKQSHTNQE